MRRSLQAPTESADLFGGPVVPAGFRYKPDAPQGRHRLGRASIEIAPRSAYLLAGPARNEWEHSIPGVAALRYSITFRNLARTARRRS